MAELDEVAAASKEVVAQGAEEVAEQATEFADAVRDVPNVRLKWGALGAAGGLVVGAAIGWKIAYKRLETKFEQIAEEEISAMRDHFRARETAREDREVGLDELRAQAKRYAPTPDEPDRPVDLVTPEVPEPEQRNVFEDHDDELPADEWDAEREIASRVPGVPHIIHKDEYGEVDFAEMTLTYYEGDDVLADAKDKVVDDQDKIVGVGNLSKFGHGSEDPNVVYVRNDELGADIEIIRNNKTYAEEVHGFAHSDLPPRRRRRSEQDE